MSKDFFTIKRPANFYRPAAERVLDWNEVEFMPEAEIIQTQAKRCMSCGIPFCHGCGCPLYNVIPDINSAVAQGQWRQAWELLNFTSPMPEFTSRVCPALCENSCSASINFDAVSVRQIEKMVVEHAFAAGWITPQIPAQRTGKRVAVIGSGPAGLAAAIALNKRGHSVKVFEKHPDAGGLLRYGIPAFKLAKSVIDRRIEVMKASGIAFHFNADIGKDISLAYLSRNYDAVLLATGTPTPRDLPIPGRENDHVLFAIDYFNGDISATGKSVVVIGGGDTGSDCVGTALRQQAKSVLQIEIMPKPPVTRSEKTPWPDWSYQLRTSSSHLEGGERRWSLKSQRFLIENGRLTGVEVVPAEGGAPEIIAADLVLLAMGFLKPEHSGYAGNVFIAGDASTGQSLVVRAIAHALSQVENIQQFLGVK